MSEKYQFIVENEGENSRLDRFLTEKLEFSRNFVRKLIKDGHVTINNRIAVKPALELKVDEEIRLTVPEPKPLCVEAESLSLNIVYEDDYLVVINKPAGMVAHPSGKRVTGTLVNALLAHFETSLSDIEGIFRPGIVHRLDEDTSGLMVVAKTNHAHRKLAELFESRNVRKTYLTLLNGILQPKEGSIEAPLKRHGQNMRITPSQNAKYALTHYKVLDYPQEKYSLVEVRIVTGRTHQIRVHFAGIGFGVVGDKKYGNTKINALFADDYNLKRQFLHAWKLSFTHPFTNEELDFTAELADDLRNVLKKLNAKGW